MADSFKRSKRWILAVTALLALAAMTPTPALAQTSCPDSTCLDMQNLFTGMCNFMAGAQANVPQAQLSYSAYPVNDCKDVNLLQSRSSNPGLFQAFPNLQGNSLTIVPLPFNASTDLTIQDVQESVVTSSALEIINANSGATVSVQFTNSISSQSSASFSHSTTMSSNTAWQVSINLNLPFELGGVAAQYSSSMSWASTDTDTSSTSTMYSSGTTETITVNGGQCVYVISQVLNSQASGTYTLSAQLNGLVGMYMTVVNAGDYWNWMSPAQWIQSASNAGWKPVGAESSVGSDGVIRLTSPTLINSQRGIVSIVPMDPKTCQQKIAAANAATPADNAPNGSARKLLSSIKTTQQPAGAMPAVVRDVEPDVLRQLSAQHDRTVRKVLSKP